MRKTIFFLFLVCCLHIECSTPTEIVSKYYIDSKYKKGYGIILCSISRVKVKPEYTSYKLNLRNIENNKKYIIAVNPTNSPHGYSDEVLPDYENDSAEGYYRTMILPVGRYKVFNYQLDNVHMGNGWTFRCKDEFEILFEVRENKTTYLGDYKCIPFKGKLVFVKQPVGGIFVISDRLNADSAVIKDKFKEFDFTNFINKTPDENSFNTGNHCIAVAKTQIAITE